MSGPATIRYTPDLSPGFFKKLLGVCRRLGCSPFDLLGVMKNESDVRATAHNHGPDAKSDADDAHGLIQFMAATLRGLGWTLGGDAFRDLSAEEQVPWVESYYRPHHGKLVSPGACYLATFLPALMKHADDTAYVLCAQHGPLAWAYAANRSFDHDKKGCITVQDLTDAIRRACVGPRWEEVVARMQEAIDAESIPPVAA